MPVIQLRLTHSEFEALQLIVQRTYANTTSHVLRAALHEHFRRCRLPAELRARVARAKRRERRRHRLPPELSPTAPHRARDRAR